MGTVQRGTSSDPQVSVSECLFQLWNIWQYRVIVWEMPYIEAIISMTFPLERKSFELYSWVILTLIPVLVNLGYMWQIWTKIRSDQSSFWADFKREYEDW